MALEGFQPRRTPPRPIKEAFAKKQPPTTMLSLRVDHDLHRKLKARAAMDGVSMTEILEKLMRDYLD